jgi:hypothetical protein
LDQQLHRGGQGTAVLQSLQDHQPDYDTHAVDAASELGAYLLLRKSQPFCRQDSLVEGENASGICGDHSKTWSEKYVFGWSL